MHCQGKSQARITFKQGSFSDSIISKKPPVTVDCSVGNNYVDFSQDMRSPISRTFERTVRSVENIGGNWNPGGKTPQTISCPTTSSNPVNSVYPEANGEVIRIEGNRVVSNFDSLYTDNSGTCIYRVYFSDVTFKISDTSGIIYEKTFTSCPKYEIACDDQCPAGQQRIPTVEYPGYKCREKCPPETSCECDCGNVICCYGSNGQLLKTISK